MFCSDRVEELAESLVKGLSSLKVGEMPDAGELDIFG
jgi:hypothetical protein